jgi:UDP-glucose 4-epimerase
MAQRMFVTGASGFLGRHLIAELEARGMQARAERRELAPDTHWRDALAGCEVVVHLAAVAHERAEAHERARDYEPLRLANALATERLAKEAAAVGVRRFVFMSTIGVCGDETSGAPFTEASPPSPRSLYAASKLEAERLLAAVAAQTAMAVTVLRPTLVYGPGNPGNLLRLLRALERGWPLPLAWVSNRRSLTYVGNLVAAVLALLDARDTGGETFVVCDEERLSSPEIVRALASGMGLAPRLVPVPPAMLGFAGRAAGRVDLVRRLVGSLEADAAKLRARLGWRAPFRSAEALARTGAWYRSRRA